MMTKIAILGAGMAGFGAAHRLYSEGVPSVLYEKKPANAKDFSLTLDKFYDNMGGNVPVGRIGEAREAGDVIAFLASERASYITGASINVDGGSSPVV